MDDAEIILPGGRTTVGVVKVGDTVRRPCTSNAEFVRSTLRHLETVGFDGAPRYLGVDQIGRETFSYLPGEVPAGLGDFDDETLRGASRLIRRFHDATASLYTGASSAGFEVACHNDLSPCNTVFRDGHPVALIDFDAAAPGLRSTTGQIRMRQMSLLRCLSDRRSLSPRVSEPAAGQHNVESGHCETSRAKCLENLKLDFGRLLLGAFFLYSYRRSRNTGWTETDERGNNQKMAPDLNIQKRSDEFGRYTAKSLRRH